MVKNTFNMDLLEQKYGVCRLDKNSPLPDWAINSDFSSITRTSDELSVVCNENNIPDGVVCEKNWRALKLLGPLDFSLIGILSSISTLLAENKIAIFAISTYETDYILVKSNDLTKAINALRNGDFRVTSFE